MSQHFKSLSQQHFQRSTLQGKEIMSRLRKPCHENFEKESAGRFHYISKVCRDIISGEGKEHCRSIPFIVATIIENRLEAYSETLQRNLKSLSQ